MAISSRNRRILGLTVFLGLALLAVIVEQRVLVPFTLGRAPVDELHYWQKHVERNEETSASHLRLGLAYAKTGRLQNAEDSFATALVLEPDYDAAAIGLYGVVVQKGEQGRALEELDRYARAHRECAACWQNLAAEYLSQRDLRAAQAAVEALLASDFSVDAKMYGVDDMEVEASVLAGRVYAARGDSPRAIGFFRAAILKDPRDLRAYILLAKNLLATDDPGSALAVLEDALARSGPDDRSARQIERLIRRARDVER
jgi:tetratricopeptide (TPR) repeat protein